MVQKLSGQKKINDSSIRNVPLSGISQLELPIEERRRSRRLGDQVQNSGRERPHELLGFLQQGLMVPMAPGSVTREREGGIAKAR